MKLIKTISEMQAEADRFRSRRKIIGFVPTMGYLHEGHLSLIRLAKDKSDVVVVSIFVNPTQFGPGEDFAEYPRDLDRDLRLCEESGCDIVFYPSAEAMYPEGYLSYVEVEKITKVLCGRSRPTHFRGVTTVVAKLFNLVKPQLAVFGQKDAQQAIVIERMVKDLNFDVDIIVAPIVREADGLAMSSRNTYLTPEQRKDATVLYRSLMKAKDLIENGERDATRIVDAMRKMITEVPSATIDYISIVDTQNLEEVKVIQGEVLVALAVKIGKTRLIDNIILSEI